MVLMVEMRKANRILVTKPAGKSRSVDLGVDGRTILISILKKSEYMPWTRHIGLRIGTCGEGGRLL